MFFVVQNPRRSMGCGASKKDVDFYTLCGQERKDQLVDNAEVEAGDTEEDEESSESLLSSDEMSEDDTLPQESSTANQSKAVMDCQDNPYGTFEMTHKLQDDGVQAEQFLYTDFMITKEQVELTKQPRNNRGRSRSNAAMRRASGMKTASASTSGQFMFSDFAVSVLSDLEDQIVMQHLEKKKQEGIRLRSEEESALFQFGDFTVTKRDEVQNRPNTATRRTIKNYTIRHLIGHSTRVKTIGLVPTDKAYASCSNMDTDVGLYDINTGHEIVAFVGHSCTVTSISISSNSKLIATASTDYNVIIWDIVTGKQLFILEHAKIVICTCFSADSKFLISGSQDKVCRVWDTRKGNLTGSFGRHSGIIICLSFSRCKNLVASSSSDKTVKIWNSLTGVESLTLSGHMGIVLSCQYSYDGQRLVSNDEYVVRIWNITTGLTVQKLTVENISPVSPLARKYTWTLTTFCPGRVQPLGQYVLVFFPKLL